MREKREGGLPSTRPQQYRAPNFSWASIDGRIQPSHPSDKGILFSVEDISIDYLTKDTTGLVKGVYIVLKCTLKKLHLYSETRESGTRSWQIIFNDVEVPPVANLDLNVCLDVDQSEFGAGEQGQDLFCMAGRRWSSGYV